MNFTTSSMSLYFKRKTLMILSFMYLNFNIPFLSQYEIPPISSYPSNHKMAFCHIPHVIQVFASEHVSFYTYICSCILRKEREFYKYSKMQHQPITESTVLIRRKGRRKGDSFLKHTISFRQALIKGVRIWGLGNTHLFL